MVLWFQCSPAVGCLRQTTVRRKEPCTWRGRRSHFLATVDMVSMGLRIAPVKQTGRGLDRTLTVLLVGKSALGKLQLSLILFCTTRWQCFSVSMLFCGNFVNFFLLWRAHPYTVFIFKGAFCRLRDIKECEGGRGQNKLPSEHTSATF